MAAHKKDMELLHGRLAKVFAEALDDSELRTPTLLNVVRQFLKDNGIGVELKGDDDALLNLRKKVPFGKQETLEEAEADIKH